MKPIFLSFIKLVLLLLFFSKTAIAQGPPQPTFRSPLGIPLVLAGTFGELRSNHFHSGLDIKTNGASGYKVYSIADGYVSRIKVQAGGYGKAVYITHYNGYTSVYCHLSVFKDAIDEYVENQQYSRQSFEVDLYPTPNELTVSKGQVIALSGNSGSSTAPHLHFEIRETDTEFPVNPLQFFEVADTKAPTLKQVGLVAFDDYGSMSENTIYYEKNNTPNVIAVAQARIGISLHAYDLLNDAPNKNGVYAIKMYLDEQIVYEYRMDKFSFYETRYLNSHIHYPAYCQYRRREHRCFREPNNQLSAYNNLVKDGIIDLYDGQVHTLKFEISDIKGNTTKHKLKLQYDPAGGRLFDFPLPTQHRANYGVPNFIVGDNFIFETDEQALYSALYMNYRSSTENTQPNFSKAHFIGPSCYAFHKKCTVKIRPDYFDSSIKHKLIIARRNDKGTVYGLSSYWENDYLVSKTKNPGTFFVTADFEAPSIKALKTYTQQNLKNGSNIKFKIADKLSGIRTYNAYIDGQWVLLDYDAKSRTVTHKLSDRTAKGTHEFLIVVEDDCGNLKELRFTFNKV